jgi:hypothetical protein
VEEIIQWLPRIPQGKDDFAASCVLFELLRVSVDNR